MEIKRPASSQIQQSASNNNAEAFSSKPDVSSGFQTGVGGIKDGFEPGKQDSFQSVPTAPSTAGKFVSSSKLNFVKQEITNYIGSNRSEGVHDPLFVVMDEYLKTSNREARQDQKISRGSSELEMASQESALLKDNEIGSAHGSRDVYQIVDQDATYELLLGQSSRLSKEDVQKDIDTMGKRLNELKQSAAEIKDKLLHNASLDDDRGNVINRYEMIASWIKEREDD